MSEIDWSIDRENFWKNVTRKYYQGNTNRVPRTIVADFVENNEVFSVLELGCNSGGNLLSIHKRCPEVRLAGIDICDRAIQYGKIQEKNPAEFFIGSIYDLSIFSDNSFDLVFTRGVLLHINHERVPLIVSEMYRIASKFILNIESHGDPVVRTYSGEIPHSFFHDFESIYRDLGMVPNINKTSEITGSKHSGGDDHLVWASVSEENNVI